MLYLKGGRLENPGVDGKVAFNSGNYNLLLEGGKVIKIIPADNKGNERDPKDAVTDAEVIDINGLVVGPGLVDVHVHFRDPGQTAKEDIHTGALAAAAGGYTDVIMMANTVPVVDCPEVLADVLTRGKKEKIHVHASCTVTKGMEGKEMTQMSELSELGAAGFTDDGKPLMDERIMTEALRMSVKLNKPISVHEENPAWISEAGVNAGKVAQALGLKGADREAEICMVERDLNILRKTGGILNLQHISAAESIELIRAAKKEGLKVHAEATPHHFSLTEETVLSLRTLAKMNPPVRTEEDRMAVVCGIMDGTLDIIATDHAPHTDEEKAREFTKAPSGIIGLETALSLAITNLVKPGYVNYARLFAAMSYNPARMYGLNAGAVYEGGPADLVIFDENEEYIASEFLSRSRNTPFAGNKLTGRVKMTICDGNIVYDARK